jgi:formate dehydrogenase major subunit
VFRLPTTCFAEEDGSLTNSGRWLQWHWKGADGSGESLSDILIMSDLFLRLRDMYRKEGGAFPDPISRPALAYKLPSPEEIAREINGYVVEDVADPKDASVVLLRAGQQLDGFAQLRDDGKTACGCWIYSGCFTEKAIRWPGATIPTRTSRALRRIGLGRGRSIVGSFTIAPHVISKVNPGTRSAS